jgi:hypothetical protein
MKLRVVGMVTTIAAIVIGAVPIWPGRSPDRAAESLPRGIRTGCRAELTTHYIGVGCR